MEKQVLSRSVPSDKSVKMREMMLILQDDWRNVARLIKDVETEKSRSMNLTYAKELKNLNNIAMDIQHVSQLDFLLLLKFKIEIFVRKIHLQRV